MTTEFCHREPTAGRRGDPVTRIVESWIASYSLRSGRFCFGVVGSFFLVPLGGNKSNMVTLLKMSESRSSSTMLTTGDPATLINELRYFCSWTASGSALMTQSFKKQGVFHRNRIV